MTARILIADGTATTRITLKVRLSEVCYDVCTASTFAELQARALTFQPDLVLIGSGFTQEHPVRIAMSLMADPYLAAVPIVMLANESLRLEALRAGVAAVLDPAIDEQMLLARIRGLLRDADESGHVPSAMAEAQSCFAPMSGTTMVTLVADSPARAMRWRGALQRRLASRFTISTASEALAAAAQGQGTDLYLIAADISLRGDGLRLLSELRSRSGSRNAAFVIATQPDRAELSAIAFDLGAGEVLPINFDAEPGVELAALALQSQLSRKEQSDKRRVATQRELLWAKTDPLTGLYNRRHALPRLAEIARDMTSNNRCFAVLVLDLDRFKTINDNYGHAAGDAVLAALARRIDNHAADHGFAARIGGEEFIVVLPQTTEETALSFAESIRHAVEAEPVQLRAVSGGGMVSATISIGVAVSASTESLTSPERVAEMTLERADRALRQAKSRGRNCVALAQVEAAF